MAGNQGDIRALLTQQTYIMLIDGGDSGTHLNALYMVDFFAHLDEGFNRIEGLGGGRIQMNDDINISTFCHILYILEGSIRVHTKAQPHVRRHKQNTICTSSLGFGSHFNGFLSILAVNTRDNGHHIAAFFCANLHNTLALSTGKPSNFTCMTIADQTIHALAIKALNPAQICTELRLVDREVIIQRNRNCWENCFKSFNLCHNKTLLISIKNQRMRQDVYDRTYRTIARHTLFLQSFALCAHIMTQQTFGVNKTEMPCNFLHMPCNFLPILFKLTLIIFYFYAI